MSDRIHRLLEDCVGDGWMPGAVWCIRQSDRQVAAGAVGAAVDLATPFDLASLTKPLATAPLLVLAEQEGRLDLDAPAETFLPELAGSRFAAQSLVMLATHRAGLPAWSPLCAKASDLAGYIEQIAAMPAAVPPGRTLYSDLGYILLGAILERVAGASLDRLFLQRIADPMGLLRTGYAGTSDSYCDAAPTETGNRYERDMADSAGSGYRWRLDSIRGEVHDANAWGLGGIAAHAGLFGTADEVARLGLELLEGDALSIEPRARRRLLEVAWPDSGRTIGFVTAGSSRAASGILPESAPGHTGFTGTSIWLDPGRRRVFVLLTNRIHPRVANRDFQRVRRAFHRVAHRVS